MVSSSFRSGLTLIEVMVTLSVFGLILVLTLWSYVQGVKATNRHNESSDVFRRANAVFGKIETQLESSQVLHVAPTYVVFHPHQSDPLGPNRVYRWAPQALTLLSSKDGLAKVDGESRVTLAKYAPHEPLTFAGQALSEQLADQRPDFLQVTFTSTPPSVTRTQTRSFQKTLILERH